MPVKLGITTCSYDTYVFLRVSSDVHFRVPKAEREALSLELSQAIKSYQSIVL